MDRIVHKRISCGIEKGLPEYPGRRVYRFIGSTADKDRIGDVIEVDGWDTKEWERNPTILWAHQHRDPPIGRGLKVNRDLERKALVFDVEFADKTIYPFAGLVSDLVDQGFLKAVSVGFRPIETKFLKNDDPDDPFPSYHYIKQELVELSVVNVPMNPNALVVSNSIERQMLFDRGFTFWPEGGSSLSARERAEERPPTTIQTLIFLKEKFKTAEAAKKWAADHDFKSDKVDETKDSFRLRQKDPEDFDSNSFRTIDLEEGVKAVIGRLKMLDAQEMKHVVCFPPEFMACLNEQIQAVRELQEAAKNLTKLVEIIPQDDGDRATPDAKASEGLAERYLREVMADIAVGRKLLETTEK